MGCSPRAVITGVVSFFDSSVETQGHACQTLGNNAPVKDGGADACLRAPSGRIETDVVHML